MNTPKPTATQAGFTLVEIAIVLVIVGLLLGGVLKGQELIENSKVRNAIKDMDGVAAANYSYLDRYKRIAGDDGPALANLSARGGPWLTVTVAGNNDGFLANLAAATFSGAGEGLGFWQHLKAAGFILGKPADIGTTALPRNAYGGLIGVVNDAIMTLPPGDKACMSQVPGKAARGMDSQLDDGLPNAGGFQATLGVAGANTPPGVAAAAYSEVLQYTVCRLL